MITLAESLPAQIKRVQGIKAQFESLRLLPNVMVEPQIAMMCHDIGAAIDALASGDVVEMIRCHEELKGYSE